MKGSYWQEVSSKSFAHCGRKKNGSDRNVVFELHMVPSETIIPYIAYELVVVYRIYKVNI